MKNQKGITLISLIVTIIVLIILVGISINLLLGDNGIITKAKKTATQMEETSANEEMEMYLASIKMEKEKKQYSEFRLADYLSSNIGNNGLEDYLNNGDGHAQVAYKGNKYLLNLNDYTFTYLGKSDGKGVNRHIKQILNSNNEDIPGVAMVEAGEIETEDLGWKVLSVNSDGTINLIADNHTSFEVSLSGISGYTNGVKALNEICSKLYGNLEINGQKVISARSANLEDFYDVTYKVQITYANKQKIQPYINTLDVVNNGYSKDQISEYIDVSNTSNAQESNTQMLLANTAPTIKKIDKKTKKTAYSMINTGNSYWLATRSSNSKYDSDEGNSEDIAYEVYYINYVGTNGKYADYEIFRVTGYNTSGLASKYNCALRPVITIPANSIENTTIGEEVTIAPFYKGKTGEEANGYVKANSIAELLGVDIKEINKIDSGLPTIETDMTWSKLTDGGYDSLTGEFDTSKYDYYIADRATKLQIRLTGAAAYNNGVLAMDTICNNLYGNVKEIKLSNGSKKKVQVVLARNAKFEDFVDDSKISNSKYGGVWSTNANDETAPNKITSTSNRYAPTLFAYENMDTTQGISKGYSDAKLSSYNLSATGKGLFLTEEQKKSYSYEKYNTDPGLKIRYNDYEGYSNRNTANASTGEKYWLTSRSVSARKGYGSFHFRYVSRDGLVTTRSIFYSDASMNSRCRSLRPVLQVAK